ncbi:hypothetical protein P2G88_04030 [Aliiglaciecola sp. CAU 1673]|uniref:hypothetical protein n=1 Tax=Aliiglaciecola sp. CAU 1673 TaxID=3032595 RepID=UPI0023DB4041|nr:hypothetical protein [Aliiglaciecola sp. CAU 1673]MDF2177413.1 hypothetical protein [Aliiglaciecola sp. CAU 1673]
MTDTDNPFSARWSAKGHTLCLGHWIIHYRGAVLVLPDKQAENDMDTFGNFSFLFPDDDAYLEGTEEDDWIVENLEWMLPLFETHGIPLDESHLRWFYQAVNAADWRCASCGGCI